MLCQNQSLEVTLEVTQVLPFSLREIYCFGLYNLHLVSEFSKSKSKNSTREITKDQKDGVSTRRATRLSRSFVFGSFIFLLKILGLDEGKASPTSGLQCSPLVWGPLGATF